MVKFKKLILKGQLVISIPDSYILSAAHSLRYKDIFANWK